MKDLIDTWNIHNRINLYLLDAIDEKHLSDIPASKGRTVGEQFAHIHNVRLMWLKAASPDLFQTQTKVEKENKITKKLLSTELAKSCTAISSFLKLALRQERSKVSSHILPLFLVTWFPMKAIIVGKSFYHLSNPATQSIKRPNMEFGNGEAGK